MNDTMSDNHANDERKRKRREANAKTRKAALERDPLYFKKAQQKRLETADGLAVYQEYQKRYYLNRTKRIRNLKKESICVMTEYENRGDDYSDLVPLDSINVFRSWAVICSMEYGMIGHEVEEWNCEV